MYAMVRRLQGTNITVNCLDPGIVESNFPMPPGCFGCCLSCIRGCKYERGEGNCKTLNPLPDMPILGSFNSAANKGMM